MATALSLLLFSPTPSSGDVDVTPDPGEPAVVLDGTRISRPDAGRPRDTRPITGKPRKREKRFLRCTIGATQSACGDSFATLPGRPDEPDDPELTEGDILTAAREIGLPSLRVRIQPGDETLVNVPTIFWTRPQAFQRSIDLLGYDVDLVASPVRYQWVHGDGTTRATSGPGRPYPAMDVTHRYRRAADDVRARVDVTYRVRYRVDGGPWQALGQTLLASGPVAQLDVREAAPVLTTP